MEIYALGYFFQQMMSDMKFTGAAKEKINGRKKILIFSRIKAGILPCFY